MAVIFLLASSSISLDFTKPGLYSPRIYPNDALSASLGIANVASVLFSSQYSYNVSISIKSGVTLRTIERFSGPAIFIEGDNLTIRNTNTFQIQLVIWINSAKTCGRTGLLLHSLNSIDFQIVIQQTVGPFCIFNLASSKSTTDIVTSPLKPEPSIEIIRPIDAAQLSDPIECSAICSSKTSLSNMVSITPSLGIHQEFEVYFGGSMLPAANSSCSVFQIPFASADEGLSVKSFGGKIGSIVCKDASPEPSNKMTLAISIGLVIFAIGASTALFFLINRGFPENCNSKKEDEGYLISGANSEEVSSIAGHSTYL